MMGKKNMSIQNGWLNLPLILILLFLLSSCSVTPWERGNLAKREMLITPNAAHSSLRAHVFESKEASSGGSGGVGGGCGCN